MLFDDKKRDSGAQGPWAFLKPENRNSTSELNARLWKALTDNMPLTAAQALEKGASPEASYDSHYRDDRDNGLPALAYAVKYNREAIAASLLKAGANPNRNLGYFCLMDYAVQHGNSRMVRLLLDHGIDPENHGNSQSWQSWPCQVAKQKCYTDIVQMLEQEPARRAAIAAEKARKKEEMARAADAAEVTERITVSKPLTLKGVKPPAAPKKGKLFGLMG
jgi:ankyrin repeat protein